MKEFIKKLSYTITARMGEPKNKRMNKALSTLLSLALIGVLTFSGLVGGALPGALPGAPAGAPAGAPGALPGVSLANADPTDITTSTATPNPDSSELIAPNPNSTPTNDPTKLIAPNPNSTGNSGENSAAKDESKLRILFTHDLHSNITPFKTEDSNGNVEEIAGYARLKTLLDQERASAKGEVITLDAGDFSMGTMFNSIFRSDAPDLQALAKMGYDATTLGNHEFDYRPEGLSEMLETAAKTIKNPVPIVASNIVYGDGADSKELKQAMTDYPSSPTKIIQKGSIKIGLLGLMGEAAKTDSPRRGTVDFTDIKSAAENAVADLKAQGANVIVALSHTGTDDTDRTSKNSEDYQLAKAVSGINFIISGHTHSEIDTPLEVNGTYIGSAKCFGEFLGEVDLKLDSGKVTLDDYSLLPSNSSVAQDPDMNNFIEELIDKVQKEFLDKYGFKFNQILAVADQTLPRQNADKDFTDPRLGKFIDDAYMYEVQKQVYNKKGADGIYRDKDGNEMPTIALSANGAIRSPLYKGNISLQDAFNVVGLGESSDEKTGYPLAVFYLKGSDLFTVAEIDASIADMMPIARLFYSGLRYYQSDARVPLNRVVDVEVQDSKGQWNSVDKNKLYPVVCNSYLADMVSIVPKKTFGLLNLVPRDSKGDELTDPQAGVLKTASGEEIPEWEAMASYLMSFPAQGISRDGKIGKVPESAFAQHVQEIDEAWSPGVMFKNLNKVSLVAGIAALLVIIIIVLLVLLVRRIVKRVRRGKNGGGSAGVSGESNPQGVLT